MMLQPGVICPAVCFYDAGGYTLTNKQMMKHDRSAFKAYVCFFFCPVFALKAEMGFYDLEV